MSTPPRHLQTIAFVAALLLTGACSNSGREHEHPSEIPRPAVEHRESEPQALAAEFIELSAEAAAWAEIRTAPVQARALAAQLRTTGQVDFDQTRLAHVSPRISGRVHRVAAQLGQAVSAGQKLAEIDSIELGQAKASYLQAKAKEELARKSFDRARSLFSDRIASEQEVLEAEAGLREATAGLRTTEESLHLYGLSQAQVETLAYDDRQASIYPLRAPFAGTLVERHATLGELVTPERNLFTLADLSRLWIWIDIYQRDLGGVHLDDEARATVDAFPDEVFTGRVSYLSARVDTDTRTVRARLDVANPRGRLRPGMFVQVELVDPHATEGQEPRATSLVVPADAIVREGEEHLVFVAAGERRFVRREVRVGRRAGGLVEVFPQHPQAGLAPGDPVVVEGAFLLKSAMSKESLGGGHEH